MSNPNVEGKKHTQFMRGHYGRLETFTGDSLQWIDTIQSHHEKFYRSLLEELEQSDNPEDFKTYQAIDRQYTDQMAALQAARERLIEATTHLKRAIVHPGDRLAHLKNVTPESF